MIRPRRARRARQSRCRSISTACQQRIVVGAGCSRAAVHRSSRRARRAPSTTSRPAPAAAAAVAGGGATLHRYRLSDRRAAAFVTGVAEYDVSADGHKLLYRTGGGAGGRGRGGAPAPAVNCSWSMPIARRRRRGRAGSNVSLRMYLEPREEFKQIFDEGWRNQRDYLYVPNAHGADWPQMKEMYGELLPYVNHRADLNYLIDNMGAEIAIGHSYVRGGDMPDVPPVAGRPARRRLRRSRTAATRSRASTTTRAGTPICARRSSAPGVDVAVGDYILAINGIELRAPDNIYRLLDGTANRQTVLTVNSKPVMEGARQVTVVPTATEQALRTRAWVEHNRRLVDKLSNGQLAYVYVPEHRPGAATRASIATTSRSRTRRARSSTSATTAAARLPTTSSTSSAATSTATSTTSPAIACRSPVPSAGIWGPKVMIINEMAGSGGDLMPYMFKRRKIGPLVGKRTWGGLVHTADTPAFIDGGSMIAPRGGFFTRDGKWAVENEGVAPDIDVENWPKDVIAGKDPQLERAVEEAMKLLKAQPGQPHDDRAAAAGMGQAQERIVERGDRVPV